MSELSDLQFALVCLVFVWSGFVRSSLGFGGAALALPILLLIDNDPLLYLPIVAIHLLIFSTLTIVSGKGNVPLQAYRPQIDWQYLKQSISIMLIPKLIGVFGLVTLSPKILSTIIFVVICIYALGYCLNRSLVPNNPRFDQVMLAMGGYISGTSLVGAPLIVAVFTRHVAKTHLRDTLFLLWFILVSIKVSSFIYFGIDMQWQAQLWLLPCAALGHYLGLYAHGYLMDKDPVIFYRWIGVGLMLTSIVGITLAWV